MTAPPGFSIRGTLAQTPEPDRLETRHDVVIEVDGAGWVTAVRESAPGETVDIDLPPGAVILPGLIDTHIHAAQWPQLGTGLDLPLERWLFDHTFPLEARLADPGWAAVVWEDLVAGTLAHGTTTAVYYATVDTVTTTLLAQTCSRHGQRALVGRVAMDDPEGTPPWYRDVDAAAGVAASVTSIEQIRAIGSPLVSPIITPRFVPACTDALLRGLAELSAATGVAVQTHCSESDWEHGYVLDRYGVTDTVALDRLGLLGAHTVLAHGNFMSDDDLGLARARHAGVAHCPLSNSYFANAVFPARRALDLDVSVGLGTDVAGGSHPGLLHQSTMAVTVSRMLDDGVDRSVAAADRRVPGARIDTVAAFWMATRGGARLLGHPTGIIEPGRSFDAFVVDTAAASRRPESALRVWPEVDDDARVFEKIVRLATASDIDGVWVAGRLVRPRRGDEHEG